jgi:signal transduction histidine kinase
MKYAVRVIDLGGRIWVASESVKGSRPTFTLPIKQRDEKNV